MACRNPHRIKLQSRLALECMAVAELAQRGPAWTWQSAAEQADSLPSSSCKIQRGKGLEAKAHLRRRRAIMNGRAWGQGTMPRRTPLATMRTGVSCISAKATATWRYTGSSRASRALMLPSAPPPTALPACRHSWPPQALHAMDARQQLPHSPFHLQACMIGPVKHCLQWVHGGSCPTALAACRMHGWPRQALLARGAWQQLPWQVWGQSGGGTAACQWHRKGPASAVHSPARPHTRYSCAPSAARQRGDGHSWQWLRQLITK